MISPTLSPKTELIIAHYLNLSFGATSVPCPYYNNRHTKMRAALRVLIGKGTPDDIEEEATLIGLREKIALSTLSKEEITTFLVNHYLGIDCSGFIFHVLATEARAQKKSLARSLRYTKTKNPLRKLLQQLRPVENTNVLTFADNRNSTVIPLSEARPGDLIILLDTGEGDARNHILLVEKVDRTQSVLNTIQYVHTLQWRIDGKFNHGVRRGEISMTHQNQTLPEALWSEQGKTGDENETWERARNARIVEVRRLRCLS